MSKALHPTSQKAARFTETDERIKIQAARIFAHAQKLEKEEKTT